jgi:serine protein kinase
MMAQFAILTRIKEPENSSLFPRRVRRRNRRVDPAKSMGVPRLAGVDEGMTGLSTRFAYKVPSNLQLRPHRDRR